MLTTAPRTTDTLPCAPDLRVQQAASQRVATMLQLLQDTLAPQRRVVRAGDAVYQAGEPFNTLYVMNSGFIKMVNVAPDGREQVVGLHFRGDWLGFDGIANGQYGCDAVAMDTGEVWAIRYDQLLLAAAREPRLLGVLHEAMSREIGRDRESMMSLCTLPADARVAEFLRHWADSLAERGLRTDQITLRMTRAEIGNYLGMTLETVSRALSRLAKGDVIRFTEKGRRDIQIPQVQALSDFIQRCLAPSTAAADSGAVATSRPLPTGVNSCQAQRQTTRPTKTPEAYNFARESLLPHAMGDARESRCKGRLQIWRHEDERLSSAGSAAGL